MVTFLFFCSHYYRSKAIRRAKQCGARAVDLPAKSFDLTRPGVAPPLLWCSSCSTPTLFLLPLSLVSYGSRSKRSA